jgi:hypothetical protein
MYPLIQRISIVKNSISLNFDKVVAWVFFSIRIIIYRNATFDNFSSQKPTDYYEKKIIILLFLNFFQGHDDLGVFLLNCGMKLSYFTKSEKKCHWVLFLIAEHLNELKQDARFGVFFVTLTKWQCNQS